ERAYRWLNAGRMDPREIADFLILDPRFPRSLSFCYDELSSNLAELARLHGGRSNCNEMMLEAENRLNQTTIDQVFEIGLHEFLVGFIVQNQAIANAIADDYRFTD
ncbi:MAG TPA: alpha-E domain-containing protein, partial [Sphingomonadaceae bacterium]|nr:alpha-E domain-containing protein [Sphingomonadaceae bacterium]